MSFNWYAERRDYLTERRNHWQRRMENARIATVLLVLATIALALLLIAGRGGWLWLAMVVTIVLAVACWVDQKRSFENVTRTGLEHARVIEMMRDLRMSTTPEPPQYTERLTVRQPDPEVSAVTITRPATKVEVKDESVGERIEKLTLDEFVIDSIAALMGTTSSWSADTLEDIANLIGGVRPHPGQDRTEQEYREAFKRRTGREVPHAYDEGWSQ